ncbi:HNH endonuclease [Pseudomonadota bacterium]
MCRGKNQCSELGTNPALWSKISPLPSLEWFEGQLDIFQEAVSEFVGGDRVGCINTLSEIRTDEMRDWYIEHGQMSGKHRTYELDIPTPIPLAESERDPLRAPKKYESQVFIRDGFRCRYCGIRLVSNRVLNTFIKSLNSASFVKGPRNLDTHGIIIIFNPVADHVVPWNLGGKTNLDNLVASCGPCNYGKDRFTIEQIGIENPFLRNPIVDRWDGLISQLDGIKRNAH